MCVCVRTLAQEAPSYQMSKKELIFIYHHVLGNKFIFKNKSDFKSDI
jgi:hypothetical protein